MSRKEEVEERNECTFELGSTTCVDGRGREGLPDDRLADIRSDEKIDSRAETVSLLQELIEENDE